MDAAIAAVVRGLQGAQNFPPATSEPSLTTAEVAVAPQQNRALQANSPFFGLGLREAGPKQLALAGKPQTAREIWIVLDAAGYQTAHGNPTHAVNDAMRRRARRHGDILLVGEGKWGRKDWYSEEQLEEIRKSMGGMGGRDRSVHSEATKTGMLIARSRGAKPGQPKKLKSDDLQKIEIEVRAGRTAQEIAKSFGVSPATIYNSFEPGYLRELKAEGRQEREMTSGPQSSKLRVVK